MERLSTLEQIDFDEENESSYTDEIRLIVEIRNNKPKWAIV